MQQTAPSPALPGGKGISAMDWVRTLNGTELFPNSWGQWEAFGAGLFRFPELPETCVVQPMEDHYISVTLAGSLRVEGVLNDQRIEGDFVPGRCLVMPAGQTNVWRWNRPTDEMHVYLRPHFLRHMSEQANITSVELVNRIAVDDPILHHIIQGIIEELRAPSGAGRLFADLTGQYLALHLLRRHSAAMRAPQPRGLRLTAAQLRRVEACIDDDLGAELSLDDLAEAARVSRFHFARAFKQTIGMPPHRWLIMRRIERAKQLLETTQLSILDIACAVGFQSQSHFGQVFRRQTGFSPAKWRRVAMQ